MTDKDENVQYVLKKEECKILGDASNNSYICFNYTIGRFRIPKNYYDNYKLFYVYKAEGRINPFPFIEVETTKEETKMLDSMVISEIEIGEVDEVALDSQMKKVANKHPELEYVQKGNTGYLVRNGSSLKLDSQDFANKVKKEVEGKTLGELKSKTLLYDLLVDLGLIKRIKLEKQDEDVLGSIFG